MFGRLTAQLPLDAFIDFSDENRSHDINVIIDSIGCKRDYFFRNESRLTTSPGCGTGGFSPAVSAILEGAVSAVFSRFCSGAGVGGIICAEPDLPSPPAQELGPSAFW